MSKSGMLRTRRRDVNVKPNRRLDRKSSRGMIYENEELRLRTININAEIERGQSDIKKLRRENEQLRKEIWCLRDEYEKLDKLLKDKDIGTTSSSCTSDSESCSSCTESEENEASQNIENIQKTNLHNLHSEFDHLSVVTEETSAECSDKNSNCASLPKDTTNTWNILPPDQSYPQIETLRPVLLPHQTPKHFFAPLKTSKSYENCFNNETVCASSWSLGQYDTKWQSLGTPRSQDQNFAPKTDLQACRKTSTDLIVKTDNFANFSQDSSSFTNGGNLEELLQDIQTISNDILQISGDLGSNMKHPTEDNLKNNTDRPYKTELSVVLMPKPMPLLGFEKYEDLKNSLENLKKISTENLDEKLAEETNNFSSPPFPNEPSYTPRTPPLIETSALPTNSQNVGNPFFYGNFGSYQNEKYINDSYDNFGFKNDFTQKNNKIDEKDEVICNNETNLENENVEKVGKTVSVPKIAVEKKEEKKESPKMRKTRKVSIYFKGKKDKIARSLSLDTKITLKKPEPDIPTTNSPVIEKITNPLEKRSSLKKNSITESKISIYEPNTSQSGLSKTDEKILNSDTKTSSDSKNSNYDRKHRKSSSTSPERKHLHIKLEDGKKGHKTKRHRKSERRVSIRNNSISIDRQRERSFSVCTDKSHILDHRFGHFDDYTNSERERTNSLSSCDSVKSRKMSAVPSFQVTGKIPWFGCWGNGCI